MPSHPIRQLSPFPTIGCEGDLLDGLCLAQSTYCASECANRVCSSYKCGSTANYHTCPHGFTVATRNIRGVEIRVNGVVETASSTAPPQFKKRHRDRKLKATEFQAWTERATGAIPAFDDAVRAAASNEIAALHDVK